MSVRTALKAATDDLHEQLDSLLGRLDLSDPQDYRTFLAIQARVLPGIEQALDAAKFDRLVPGWADHRRSDLLQADLDSLGVIVEPAIEAPDLKSPAEAVGAAYVIEGSRLGGRFLVRSVAPSMPQHFLSAPGQERAWPAFVTALERLDFSEADLENAGRAARHCFAMFLDVTREAICDE